ncbi:dihydrodipicolinate synthase family protein [Geminicoccaceae bacterium 1502E]|nr:dihydrodipicolinate synthase family protein [Geminicoccaceae bacterium 1502E]
MSERLRGIVASLNTPFAADEALDERGIAALCEECATAGCAGVLVPAVAGEVGSLTTAERRRLLALVAEHGAGRLQLVAGVSATGLDASLALAREAFVSRPAMVLWQAPSSLGAAELADSVGRLAEAAGAAVMVQDLDWQGSGLSVAAIAEAARREPALAAVKVEVVPAGPKYTALREAAPHLHLSGGWAATQMLDGLVRGLDAFVPTGMLAAYVRVFDLFAAGERDAARTLFERMLPVLAFTNQHIDVSIRFWKRWRHLRGVFATDRCRAPVAPLDAVQEAEAAVMLARASAVEEAVAGRGGSNSFGRQQ